MSLLSYTELCALVETGVIENCPLELVNGASIDVTLAETIMCESLHAEHVNVDFRKRDPLQMFGICMDADAGHLLLPGDFILASSQQIFNLPANIAAEFKLKSSAARIGLTNLLAGWCDPTWHGSALTMELLNCTRAHNIRLRPGDRLGQMVFYRCAPVPYKAAYAQVGRYNGDRAVRGIKT